MSAAAMITTGCSIVPNLGVRLTTDERCRHEHAELAVSQPGNQPGDILYPNSSS